MSEVLLNQAQVALLSNAKSPEEAAQIFLSAVTRGLATVIAQKLDETLKVVAVGTKAAAPIAGWNSLVKGCSIQLDWERPSLGCPVGQITCFAPRETDGLNALGVEFNIGIGIKGTF